MCVENMNASVDNQLKSRISCIMFCSYTLHYVLYIYLAISFLRLTITWA